MWEPIVTKQDLSSRIAAIANISEDILDDGDIKRYLKRTSVAQRMSWAASRVTTRIEDEAYCLLGIFDINVPLLYGEGARAFRRLQLEIIKERNDESIFAWGLDAASRHRLRDVQPRISVLAASARDFVDCEPIYQQESFYGRTFSVTNLGLKIRVPQRAFLFNDEGGGRDSLNLELQGLRWGAKGEKPCSLMLHLHQERSG